MLRCFRLILGLTLAATAWPQTMGDVPTAYFGPVRVQAGQTARLAFSNLFGQGAVLLDMAIRDGTSGTVVAEKKGAFVDIGGFEVIEYPGGGNLFGVVRRTGVENPTTNTSSSLQVVDPAEPGAVILGEPQSIMEEEGAISQLPMVRTYRYGPLRLLAGQKLVATAHNPTWNGQMGLLVNIYNAATGALIVQNKTTDTMPGHSQTAEMFLGDGTPFVEVVVSITKKGRPLDYSANSVQVLLKDGKVIFLATPRLE